MVPYGCGDDDEGIDFEVGELEIDVDAVESDDKVDQYVLSFGGDMGEEILLEGGERGERLGGSNDDLGGLGIDITDVNTAFMVEQDVVSFTFRVDVDVVLCLLGMGNKWFDEEVGQVSLDMLNLEKRVNSCFLAEKISHLLQFASAFFNPLSALFPALVETQEPALASSLDQHVWFGDEFPPIADPGVQGLGAIEDLLDVCGIVLRGNAEGRVELDLRNCGQKVRIARKEGERRWGRYGEGEEGRELRSSVQW
jgi:hypothetical protein